MKRNNSLKEISEELIKAQRVLIFPHIMADGDALGSSSALCNVLRRLGKEAFIVMEDNWPKYLEFLERGYYVNIKDGLNIEEPYLSIAVDCGEYNRFPKRKELFIKGQPTVCVDHHPTTLPIFDFNYIDSKAAATGEIMYDLIMEMDCDLTKEEAESLYVAISTDTGSFKYSNTSAKSHEIVSHLYSKSIDSYRINVALYETQPLEKVMLMNKAISTLHIFAEGKGAIAIITKEMLKDAGANSEMTDQLIVSLRAIEGVEIAAVLKEQEDGSTKASLRAKEYGDVSVIAAKHGGGGHVKAAGCTLHMDIEEAKTLMIGEIEKAV